MRMNGRVLKMGGKQGMSPYEMGKAAYHKGQPLEAAPWPEKTPDGDVWRNGWKAARVEAEGASEPEPIAVVPLRLSLSGSKFVLEDQNGRRLGDQLEIHIHQDSDNEQDRVAVTATFANVYIST